MTYLQPLKENWTIISLIKGEFSKKIMIYGKTMMKMKANGVGSNQRVMPAIRAPAVLQGWRRTVVYLPTLIKSRLEL